MIREILKIRTDLGLGNNNPAFKDIELTEYSAKFSRMGMPSLTATLMWPTPLDNEWSRNEFVVLRGERFYIRHTPSGKKDNKDARYSHEIEFTSEFAEILGNTYFVDAVPDKDSGIECITANKPCTNNTTFNFYGTITELCDRINCAFLYSGIGDSILRTKTSLTTADTPVGDGYCVMVDPYGDYDYEKSYEFSFEDKKLWEVITEGFNVTSIPFERRGRRFIFGAVPNVVEHKFEYGYDNELLSVSKNNANAQVINRITMLGSTENIPHYYPNETEYGHISIQTKSGNKVLTANMIEITGMTRLLSNLNADDFAILKKYDDSEITDTRVTIGDITSAFESSMYTPYTLSEYLTHKPSADRNTGVLWHIRVAFNVAQDGRVSINELRGNVWKSIEPFPSASISLIDYIKIERLSPLSDGVISDINYTSQTYIEDGKIGLGYLSKGNYVFQFAVNIPNRGGNDNPITAHCYLSNIEFGVSTGQSSSYYWEVGNKKYSSLGTLGVNINGTISDAMVGDGFGWKASGRMAFQDHLMPSKYRETTGTQRFYNALNNAYIDPDTRKPYVFPNPFIEGSPSEYIYRNEDIKPTIEGVTNESGQLMGVIADIAYDSNDNDVMKPDSEESDKNDALKYEHSFFYIKLNIFNGRYGFDLFSSASQTDPMTIQMTSGNCNGCKFKIQVLETEEDGYTVWKNPVQTKGPNGDLVPGDYEDKVSSSSIQTWQQNTQTHSIWICVQKDAETFGVLMPNQSNNFKPEIGDKFNIINIDLLQGYILAAENRLEEEGIRFMADNNEEKFTFDIQVSRIFFAENPDVLAQLDEYSKIKVHYNGKVYEQYVNQLSIDYKDSEPLPNIGIDLTDTLAVGESFVENVAERAASLVANAINFGTGTGGGMSAALAERRYLNKQKNDRTPFRLNVGDLFTAESGAHFGDFVQGMYTGRGGAVDGAGNAEFESIVSRSYLKVMELIYNRLNAQEGDTSFSESGTIDVILDMPDGSRVAKIRKRWDGDFTAFQPGDVVYGYVNDLDRADSPEYYKAWAWIKSVDRANNQITIVEYPDSEVPSGRNHPLSDGMMIARWGNNIEATLQTYINPEYSAVIGKRSDGTYYNKRQQSFYISCEEGNIVELMGVYKPILEKGNYGTILGNIPDGLLDPTTAELINKGQPYLFARGVIVQDLIRIGYEGLTTRVANYRGKWDEATAKSDADYYRSTPGMYDTVTHNGALWQCVVSENPDEPSDLNPAWVKMTASLDDDVIHMWTINPNATVISIRDSEVVPEVLTSTVTLNSNNGATIFTSNIDLYDEGAELFYSLDGKIWKKFIIGNAEPLDLEDNTGVIEMEDSVDGNDFLVVGGDNLSTKLIGDRIYFELRSVEDGMILASTQVPVVKDGERGAFQSTVFIRTNEEPDTPTGGTYNNPIPTSQPEWSDAIPAGEEILWASTRIFDNRYETEWEKPRQMTDTATYDVEFSDTDKDPGNPTDNPDKWYDPDADKDKVDFTQMLWRAERRKKNGIWSGWTIVRIKGESGDWVSYVFKESITAPAKPTGKQIIPSGWSDAPKPEGVWWMSKAMINAGTGEAGEWSDPVKVTGEDGENGGYTDFKYNKNKSLTDPPQIIKALRNPDGWYDNPPQLSDGEYLWMSQAEINYDNTLSESWSTPVRISGENGRNGDWTTYVFKKSDVKPGAPTGTDIVPEGWEDAPGGDGKWWMSKAVVSGITNEAGVWSDPMQVTAEDGKPGRYTDFKYRVYPDDVFRITVDDTVRNPAGWSDKPPMVEEGYVLWMIQAEIDYDDSLIGKWSTPVRISGETGADGGEISLWTINPNTNIVNVREKEVVPAILSATVILNSSLGSPIEFTSNIDLYDAGAKLYFSVDGKIWEDFIIGVTEPLDLEDESGVIELEDSVDDSQFLTVGGNDVNTNTIADRIFFELRSIEDGTVLATTQVPVVKDGAQGLSGRNGLMAYPAGVFDRDKLYTAENETVPVVQYGDEDKGVYNYFRLKEGTSYRGADMPSDRDTPAKDTANSGVNAVWVRFDDFDSVFANIIMANFAKLSYAVFYGEWMISQEGLLNGEPSNQYQCFKDGSFIPNFAVNYKTGEIRAANGIFEGSILQRFKDIEQSDAEEISSDTYKLKNDLNVVANAVTITLPTDISYAGYRVAIANNIQVYSKFNYTTYVKTDNGSNILGFPKPKIVTEPGSSLPRPGGSLEFSGPYEVTMIGFLTGVIEFLAIPDESGSKCLWYITSFNAYLSETF